MRRIISKHKEEKKRKRNLLIIGIILIFVMFGSVFGIIVGSFGQSREKELSMEYNGYEFFSQNGLWYTSAGNLNFAFTYHPTETIDVQTNLNPLNNYQNNPLYIYSEDPNAEIEIYRNFQQIVERIQSACFSNEKCEGDYPIKTCSDNFIIIEISEKSEIIQSGNCIYIKGSKEKLLELTDEFLFKVIGIK